MGFVGMNKIMFASAVLSMNRAADGINTTDEVWSSMGEASSVFELFVAEFEQLQAIFKLYKQLALKNIKEIQAIGGELIKMDQNLMNLWK